MGRKESGSEWVIRKLLHWPLQIPPFLFSEPWETKDKVGKGALSCASLKYSSVQVASVGKGATAKRGTG